MNIKVTNRDTVGILVNDDALKEACMKAFASGNRVFVVGKPNNQAKHLEDGVEFVAGKDQFSPWKYPIQPSEVMFQNK